MASIQDFLQGFERVKGDTRAQAALTTEFLLTNQPEEKRETLRAALDAAAVLHWFNAELLEEVLEIAQHDARSRFETLREHPFVETYRDEKEGRFNIQESTRLGWRAKLANETPLWFRD